uniref:Adenylosuccinate synthetase n=1 Tax=Biomphalaria glabrata TaxID=6526 RepID=A0A2C9JR38_BIOGL
MSFANEKAYAAFAAALGYFAFAYAQSVFIKPVTPGASDTLYNIFFYKDLRAAYAMIMAAPKEKRVEARTMIISAASTSFLLGITEPIEYTFLLLAPVLFFGFHAIMAGRAEGAKLASKAEYQATKSGKKVSSAEDDKAKFEVLTKCLGGKSNIKAISNCASRLRITVIDASKVEQVFAPGKGTVDLVTKCVDEVFKEKMVGDGIIFTPSTGEILAPVTGEVTMVAETKHAINIQAGKVQILIHIGIDTVKLNGEGFNILVSEGQKVQQGDKIAEIDLNFLKKKATSIQTPIIAMNEGLEGLNKYLQSKKVKTLEIVGVATDYCVSSTISDAINFGYKVTTNINLIAENDQLEIIDELKSHNYYTERLVKPTTLKNVDVIYENDNIMIINKQNRMSVHGFEDSLDNQEIRQDGYLKNIGEKMVVTDHSENTQAFSQTITPVACENNFSLLRVHIHTGKKHQIRAGLASIGFPVVGDMRYGHAEGPTEIADALRFDRKHYFYPDLPKGYQITQFYNPIGVNGNLEITLENGIKKRISISKIILEEDTASMIHHGQNTKIDYNRAGNPLLEIVSSPDISNSYEAVEYIKELRRKLIFANISFARFELGQFRCDLNVSVSEKNSDKMGTRIEIKNLNSLANIKKAIDNEVKELTDLLESGDNAGHTIVVNNVKYKLRLLPSGILHSNKTVILGNGVVVNLDTLAYEIEILENLNNGTKLKISDRAHLVMPYHIAMDELYEEIKGAEKVGTTKRGIGPCYEDKISRIGIRVHDLFDKVKLEKKITFALKIKNQILKAFGKETFEVEPIVDKYFEQGKKIQKYVDNTGAYLEKNFKQEKNALFEGAQGVMLCIDHGTYPYVTSSSPTAASIALGNGIDYHNINNTLGVIKAYATRVGEGSFLTEEISEIGDTIREKGHEYGTVTKRPRRIG